MTRNQKIVLGVLTFSPILLLIFYFIAIFSTVFGVISAAESGQGSPENFMVSLVSAFGIIGLMLLITFGLMIYYLIHITKNPRIEGNMQVVWILLIVFAGLVGNMVYWFVHIWNTPQDDLYNDNHSF